MGGSLFDQLKKTGLVDKNKAQQASKKKHLQSKQQKGKKAGKTDESKLRAQQVQAEQAARDRELNLKQKQAAEQKASAAQIRQLIEMNRIDDDGDIGFNFVDDSNVQQIYVSEKVQDELVRGQLAIIKLQNRYELVPVKVAEKIALRDSSCVILCNAVSAIDSDDDDLYADYKVPDDLMWSLIGYRNEKDTGNKWII